MRTLTVVASKTYPIYLDESPAVLQGLSSYCKGDKVAVVTDDNVAPLCLDTLLSVLPGKKVLPLVVPHGEASKSMAQYASLLAALADADFTRRDTIVTLGGGVVGDLGAFVASTYMRGIGLVAVPTSLLAMVDSAVGGKTAINLDKGKNLCGTFYQPDAVYVCTSFLSTLPRREMQCGWGEILKYAFLDSAISRADLHGDVGVDLIAKCLACKARIVMQDEREGGVRKLLNLGHTIGHAIERLSTFDLTHGECVAKGLYAALLVSRAYYDMPDNARASAMSILTSRGHDLTLGYTPTQLVAQLGVDKKSDATGTDMVLLTPNLSPAIVHLAFDQIEEYLSC